MSARRSPSSRVLSSRALPLALVALGLAPRAAFAQVPPPPAPPTAPAGPAATPSAGNAKTFLAAGDKAAKAKDWSTALAQYQAAMSAQPSSQALQGVANAQYQLKMSADAYTSYDELLKVYGKQIGTHAKTQAEARLKELAATTGYVSIRVNESGADVAIDGKSVGTSPVAALIRVATGPHKVDVTKAGFNAASMQPNVQANGKEIVDVNLTREATTGHLVVKEKNGASVRVLVDGTDVGAAPIDLELPPGPHQITVRNATMQSPAQKVEIEKGKTADVELTAVAATAHLEITTSDRQGIIFLDGKPVAEGAYAADVAPGQHTIAVTRDGFERYEKTVTLADKQTVAETVTLKLAQASATRAVSEERTYDGIYGGIGALGLIQPGGNGNEIEDRCYQLGATSCSTPAPLGGGLMGWFGYAWHPVGIEAFIAAEGDETTPSATFTRGPTPGANPLAIGVPRVEQYAIIRGGGTGAVRARLSFQSERIRGSLAAGFGLSLKAMELLRRAKANDGTQNAYNGGINTYLSPALSIDGSIALRTGGAFAIAFGILTLMETAGQGTQSPAAGDQYLGGSAGAHPIATPAYHYAQSTQIFFGPYIGLQFGP